MGVLFAYLAAQITAALKRAAVIYGLMAVGGVFVLCAGAYGLASIATVLTFRYGPLISDVVMTLGLLVVAAIALTVAIVLKKRPAKAVAREMPAQPRTLPRPQPYSAARIKAVAAAVAGAVSAGTLIAMSRPLRDRMAGRRTGRLKRDIDAFRDRHDGRT